jgi:hypothetical protein
VPGLFLSLTNLPMNKSPHQSPPVVMPSHHMNVYILIKEKNACNDAEFHPYEENARGAA